MTTTFDRTDEDVGNVVHLEHVNLCVPDQITATQFYVSALGLTRDPYVMTGTENMWINAGRTQFHLPLGTPQQFSAFLKAEIRKWAQVARDAGLRVE